jgi:hypothetical protein
MINISDWIYEHPFKLVFSIVFIVMVWHTYEFGYRARKHQKHLKEIEEKKKRNGCKKF